MFASRVKKTVTITDGDETVDVVIRKLSARSLDAAEEAAQARAIKKSRDAGGELVKAFRETATVRPADAAARTLSRYRAYDPDTIVRAGVESWTSKVPVETGVQDLDEEAREKLHREILDISLPPLDPAEAEAAGKGDSGASISS